MKKGSTKDVYIVSCELSGESQAFSDSETIGGFVSCLVPTNDIRDAIDLAENALFEDGYTIAKFERVELFEEDEWADNSAIVDGCREAQQSGQIGYTTFHVFENEYEH